MGRVSLQEIIKGQLANMVLLLLVFKQVYEVIAANLPGCPEYCQEMDDSD